MAQLLVHGGTIHTLDPGVGSVEVLVVRDGRIAEVGGLELKESVSAEAVLDLEGRTLVPGLIDAHAHVLGLGRLVERIDLRDTRSFDEVLERVAEAAARAEPGEVLVGRGWNHELWPDRRFPTHERLSSLTPDHPVLLRRVDGHATLANERAMELSGIGPGSEAPPGGRILRGADGRPTGLFIDAAADLLMRPPEVTAEVRHRRLLRAQEACLRAGLTGVHDAGVPESELELYEDMAARGELKLRINAMLTGDFERGGRPAPWLARRLAAGPARGAHDGRLTVTAVKIYADGALGSRGAALLQPYTDRPDVNGLLQLDRDDLEAQVRAVREAGFQAAVHAIGDAANRMALDVYEEVLGEAARTDDHRFRIEHAQVIALDDIPRFAELGVIASVQPTHATSDMDMAEDRVGPLRIRGAYCWRRLTSSGARLALGSDFPVESERPLWGLYAAITRQDHDGRPEGGWRADQRLTPAEALRGFTLDAAWAGFDEGRVGSLAPGKWADFVVLPFDPLKDDPRQLVADQVESTWIAGEQVFSR